MLKLDDAAGENGVTPPQAMPVQLVYTHSVVLPVSRVTLTICGGDPIEMGTLYERSR